MGSWGTGRGKGRAGKGLAGGIGVGPGVVVGAGAGMAGAIDLEAAKNSFVGPHWLAWSGTALLCAPLPLSHAPCTLVPHLCRPAVTCIGVHKLAVP